MSIERSLVHSFVGLDLSIGFVRVEVGSVHEGIHLSAEAEVLEQLDTKIEGGVLYIRPSENASISTNIPIEVSFSIPTLSSIKARAGSQVRAEGQFGDSLDLWAESGAQIRVKGRVQRLRAFAESGGLVDTSGLSAKNVSCQSNSGGRINS